MRVILITSNEPFFLADSVDYFLEILPVGIEPVALVLTGGGPQGRGAGFIGRAVDTWKIFGTRFFVHYALKFIGAKMGRYRRIEPVLEARGVPLIRFTEGINSEGSRARLRELAPDVIVSIAGGEIYRKDLLALPVAGCINLHTSLLPKYRGLLPTFWVLKENEQETGVSVFFIDEGIDSGPIIVQRVIPIAPDTSQQQLIRLSKRIGMEALVEALEKIRSGTVQIIENNEAEMTYFSFPARQDVREFLRAGGKFF